MLAAPVKGIAFLIRLGSDEDPASVWTMGFCGSVVVSFTTLLLATCAALVARAGAAAVTLRSDPFALTLLRSGVATAIPEPFEMDLAV